MADEREIIEAVLGGDVDRYAELVSRYQLAAWKLAYSLVGNMDDAKELSQNAFVSAYQRLGRFQQRARFSTWLYRIVVNECKDFLRQRARRPAVISMAGDPDADEPRIFEVADPSRSPAELATDRELAGRLETAIRALADHQRTAFVLHHLNGLPLDQVAEVMGCRVGTVKSHVFRACERLRKTFETR